MAASPAPEMHATSVAAGLDWLLGTMPRDSFMQTYWNREPLHIARGDQSYYWPLATAEQVHEITGLAAGLCGATKTRTLIELVGGERSAGSVRLRNAVSNSRSLWQAHARGSTILVQMAQRYWAPLARLCKALEAQLRAPLDATLICTPASCQAFGRHFDRLDAIVIQLAGRKSWRLLGEAQPAPVQELPLLPFETIETGRDRLAGWNVSDRSLSVVNRSVILEPGDLLYVPRGMYHEVWTEDEDSAHITLAVRPVTYVDLIIAALGRYAERIPAVRAGLMPDVDRDPARVQSMLHELALDFARTIDAKAALGDMEVAYKRSASDVEAAGGRSTAELAPTSTLVHVSSHRPTLVCNRGVAEFYYGDRLFRLPERASPALRFISENRLFRVDQLPGLTPGSAMVLARRLVRANVVRVLDLEEAATHPMETDDEH